MPGQPYPVYPPGQFSLWNRASTRAAWLGISRPGDAPAEAEPSYSVLAVSDPSADMTATQTWAVIDDDLPGGWGPPPVGRDWGSHADKTSPPPHRPDSRPQAQAGLGAGPSRTGRRARPGQGAPWEPAGQPASPQRGPVRGGQPSAISRPGGPASAKPGEPASARPGEPGGGGQRPRRGGASRQATASSPPAPGSARQPSAAPKRTSQGRRGATRGRRHNVMMASLVLSPVLVVVLVVGGYVYLSSRHAATAGRLATPTHAVAAPSSPGPSLGPWKHIESRTQDPEPLTLKELFPAQFSSEGTSGVRTVARTGTRCARAVIGSGLRAAVRKAGCTQVLRASYLSSSRKVMATIGVLNLVNVTSAERVGTAAGATEFIKQLPAAHGPTHRLTKGTGLEQADVKGHYLILIWAEFADLHKPSGAKDRGKLERFSTALVNGTANVSLTARMVTGKP